MDVFVKRVCVLGCRTAVPGKCSGLTVSDITKNACRLRWKPPEDDGGSRVMHYVVERQEVGKPYWTTIATFAKVILSLDRVQVGDRGRLAGTIQRLPRSTVARNFAVCQLIFENHFTATLDSTLSLVVKINCGSLAKSEDRTMKGGIGISVEGRTAIFGLSREDARVQKKLEK